MASKPQDAKITLHWLNKSRSQRIVWLLEELGVKYDVKVYHRNKEMRAPPELKKVFPLGKSPVITVEIPGEKPIVLAESGVIVEYLIDHYGPHLTPKQYKDGKDGQVGGETDAWLRNRYYMHFAEGSLMPPMVIMLIAGFIRKTWVPFFIKPIINRVAQGIEDFAVPEVKQMMDMMESDLGKAPDGGPWMCGKQLTGTDILLSYPVEASAGRVGLSKDTYPNLMAYVERIKQTESYKRAVQKIVEVNGEYDGLSPE